MCLQAACALGQVPMSSLLLEPVGQSGQKHKELRAATHVLGQPVCPKTANIPLTKASHAVQPESEAGEEHFAYPEAQVTRTCDITTGV
jgi:hypothetical protein